MISEKVVIGSNVQVGYQCVIMDGAVIGDNVVIGHNVIIYEDTIIGEGTRIHDNAVIGKRPMRAATSVMKDQAEYEPAVIGNYCTIGTNAVIYKQCRLADKVFVADLATVREHVSVGEKTIIGRNVAIENECTIGANCKIETNAYITAFSTLGDYVFIAPGVVTSNDNYIGRTEKRYAAFKGCTVRRGGRVGAGSTLLPGIVVEEEGVIGAGSVVTRTVPSRRIVVGAPARDFREVDPAQLLENDPTKK